MNFTASIPYLKTERLILREYRPGDFEAFAAHLADPDCMPPPYLSDRKTAWRIFGSHTGLWILGGAGWWAIEHRDTGELVGNVGAFFRDRDPVLELGWNTYKPFWGQGIAGEAATAVLQHAFEVQCRSQVQALIGAGNRRSIQVAERLGFRYANDTDLDGHIMRRYMLERV